MIRILYLSQSSRGTTDLEVQRLLTTSRRNNPDLGVTGVLIHGGGLFMQFLEGPDNNVMRLYAKITDDQRHGDCQIIHIAPTVDRVFQKWSMGLIPCDPLQFHHITQLREQRYESVPPKTFTASMNVFLRMLNSARPADAAPPGKSDP